MTKQYTIKNLNALFCLFICSILIMAFFIQYWLMELPCPLCLLQRFGLLSMAFGFALNAYYEPKSYHYSLAILSALFTAAVASRQILLHIVPNTGNYGSPIFGFHLYVWSFLLSNVSILFAAFLLIKNSQFNVSYSTPPFLRKTYFSLILLVILLSFANAVTTFKICGWHACPDDPKHYV